MSYLDDRRNHINAGRPLKQKKVYKLKPISDKKAAKIKAEKERLGGDDTELIKWYKARMKQMSGRCNETGLKTETRIYAYAIMSICHLLDKRDTKCPSVKTHPFNWIELAPDVHTMFDKATWKEREMMGCWETIRDRLILVYPSLAESERRHFPESVLNYMNKSTTM
jgi:hypothetical protein